MGRRWRPFSIGGYHLGQLHGEAVATWTEGDKRRRYRLGVATEEQGRAELARFAKVAATAGSGRLTVADIFESYVRDREIDGKQVWVFRENWKALQPLFGSLTPDAITDDVCRAYAKERFRLGRARSTVWNELTRLRSALNWAHKRRKIESLPYVWVPSKGKGRQRVLTEAEFIQLSDSAGMPHVRLFILLLLTTAARHAALVELTWDRVDFEAGTIDLEKPEEIDPMSKASRKGRALVPMNNLARAALSEAKAGALTDHVIEWNTMPVRSVKKGFQAAVRRAGLSNVTPHTIRHTAASWAWEKTTPEKVARLLGHKDVRTTRSIYAHPTAGFAAEAAEAVDLKVVRPRAGRIA